MIEFQLCQIKERSLEKAAFKKLKTNDDEIEFNDLQNSWTFHHLFTTDDQTLYGWLRQNRLLAETVKCLGGEVAKLQWRGKAADKFALFSVIKLLVMLSAITL